MPKLHDELGQDDWDGQDWADDSTHQVSQRTEEKENYQGANLVELDDGGYVSNWKSISDQRRQDTDYTCEKCRVRLQDTGSTTLKNQRAYVLSAQEYRTPIAEGTKTRRKEK